MIAEVKKLIAEDKIEAAIALLDASNNQLTDTELVLLKNQLQELKAQYLGGTVTNEIYSSKKTKLLETLLWLAQPDAINIGKMIADLEKLRAENQALKQEVAFYRDKEDNFNGFRFEELYKKLSEKKFTVPRDKNRDLYLPYSWLGQLIVGRIDKFVEQLLEKEELNLNEIMIVGRKGMDGLRSYDRNIKEIFEAPIDYGLLILEGELNAGAVTPKYTEVGKKYLIQLLRMLDTNKD